jgi:hypothetical protein
MAGKVDSQLGGKRAELYVMGELLKRGAVPYLPLVDVEGVDAYIRTSSGKLVAIQIKSSGTAGSPSPRWFEMRTITPGKDFFIIGVECPNGVPAHAWVFPSTVFDKYAPPRKSGTCGLNLDTGAKKYGMPLRDLLCGFRNRWELITNYDKYEALLESPEDLEDILTMKEATEAPREEGLTLEEYERRQAADIPG